VRDLRQEVPDRQDTGGSPPGRPPQPEAVLVQALRLQGRTKSLAGLKIIKTFFYSSLTLSHN
jgi:hypothetical protein